MSDKEYTDLVIRNLEEEYSSYLNEIKKDEYNLIKENIFNNRNINDFDIEKIINKLAKMLPDFISQEIIMKLLLKNSFLYMINIINKNPNYFISERNLLIKNIHKVPFNYCLSKKLFIDLLDKNDERRLSFQILFLFILRKITPLKYNNSESFLRNYPEFKLSIQDNDEIEKLFNYANWMNLLFQTIDPNNNKGYSIDIITRICEGKDTVYITGGSPTLKSIYRIEIFHHESGVKIISKPKKLKEKLIEKVKKSDRRIIKK